MTSVSGPLIDSSGAPVPGAILRIAPTSRPARSRAEGVEVPSIVLATADGSGVVTFEALSGAYAGTVVDGARQWPVQLIVPPDPTASLAACIEAGGPEIAPASVAAAQAAAASAVSAAAVATTASSAAVINANLVATGPGTIAAVSPGLLLDGADTIIGSLGQDPAGYAPAIVLTTGVVAMQKSRVMAQEVRGTLTVGGHTVDGAESNYDWSVADPTQNVVLGVQGGELLLPSYVTAEAINRARALSLQDQPMQGIQQPVADFNTIVVYGQSLAMAQESWPALSVTQQFGNLMLGGDVRPGNLDGAGWTQVSPTGLQPLVAKVRSTAGAILDATATAALAAGDAARGEMPGVAMANLASWMIQRRMLKAPAPFVVICPAVSGKTIDQLSKTNPQDAIDRYSRFTAGLTQTHAAATTGANAGRSHAVAAIVYMQGEYDYITTQGSTKATKAAYKAALIQLRNDMVADTKLLTGQTEDPIFLLYQTGAIWTADVDSAGTPGLHIGMAQLEVALENPGTVAMAGPVYPVTDKGGHLDCNGTRWFGLQLGKVFQRTVIEGTRWRPLSPTRIEQIAPLKIRIHFHVPCPPLAWGSPYVVATATAYSNRGFRITDVAGDVPLTSVALVGGTMVDIVIGRLIDAATARVWYASKTVSSGNGNLRDSDPFLSRDLYEYTPGTGQYASANIPGLVGAPYPLWNWCAAFHLPLGYSE